MQITIEQMNPSVLPVMGFILESKDMNLIELKMLAKYTVKPFLSQIEGVSKIQIQGGKDKEYWVGLNSEKMNVQTEARWTFHHLERGRKNAYIKGI